MANNSMKRIAEKICAMIYSKDRRQPEPYGTNAEVRRVEDGRAFVHIPGGVDETPAKMGVNAEAGDQVHVSISDGSALLDGNLTNPPTDDKTARKAQRTATKADSKATEAKETAEQAETTANAVSGVANNALTQAQQAKQIADDTEQHFWFQETGADTGAHITEVTQEEWSDSSDPNYHSGGNFLARSNGAAVRDGLKELATMSQNGFDAISYDDNNDPVPIVHLGYGPGYNIAGTLSDDPYYTLGQRNTAYHVGNYSVVEGVDGHAMAYCSHAEGYNSCVSSLDGIGAHAEGYSCNATWKGCHAEGYDTYSAGIGAHAEGYGCQAAGKGAHAGGYYTLSDSDYQTVIGKYNSPDMNDTYALIIGNGTGSSIADRSDAFTVDWGGNVTATGNVTASNIGAKNWVTPSAVSCATGKWYKVAEVTLDPGIWFLDCNAAFPATNTTGTRQIRVTTATFTNGTTTAPTAYDNLGIDILVAGNTAQYPQVHFPVDISSQTTFRLAAYQGSNSTVSVTGRIRATRIK